MHWHQHKAGKWILIEMKLLATCTDDFFCSCFIDCSHFMIDEKHNWKSCDWFIYSFFCVDGGSRLRFFLCRRHPASIKAPECVHWNLFPVNSLNNLHHVARLTSLRRRPFFLANYDADFLPESHRTRAPEELLALANKCGDENNDRRGKIGKCNYLFKRRENVWIAVR